MHSISITYTLIYHISFAQEYKFSKCKKLFNCKSNKQIRQIINGGSIGYCIRGRFYSLKYLKQYLAKIPEEENLRLKPKESQRVLTVGVCQ